MPSRQSLTVAGLALTATMLLPSVAATPTTLPFPIERRADPPAALPEKATVNDKK